jgi:glycerophosphoryl diester phosphodiesterase
MDTHISKDGQVFLSHDNYINPSITLDPSGKEIPE